MLYLLNTLTMEDIKFIFTENNFFWRCSTAAAPDFITFS